MRDKQLEKVGKRIFIGVNLIIWVKFWKRIQMKYIKIYMHQELQIKIFKILIYKVKEFNNNLETAY